MEHIGQIIPRLKESSNLTNIQIPIEETLEKLTQLNISSLENTFENFVVLPENKQALEVFKSIGRGDQKEKFVLHYGTTGCGKTHLIEALLLAWADRGIKYRYKSIATMLRYLRRAQDFKHIPPLEEVLNGYYSSPRLILDDYGMGITETQWEQSILEEIIDERYRRRKYPGEMITILTTNKDIKQLPDRIKSRFSDRQCGAVIVNRSGDFRKRVRNELPT